DPNDRRVNRLYLKPAARPLLDQLATLSESLMGTVLEGIEPESMERMLKELGRVKNNLRTAIQNNSTQHQAANG
ncbi:MAG: hypothetical protein ACXWKR_12305, partial [Phenylobacterium sp.]